jgi:hypothetical protein
MTFTKTVTTILSNKTAGTSASTTLTDCTTIDTTSCINLALSIRLTFNASATLGGRIKVFGSNDDSTYATNPFWQGDVAFASGAQESMFQIPSGIKYLKVQVTNLDTAQTITAIYVDSHVQTVS